MNMEAWFVSLKSYDHIVGVPLHMLHLRHSYWLLQIYIQDI